MKLDVSRFFDAISHEWMVRFVEHRVADKRVLRLIQKMLSAGVMEQGQRIRVEAGTPQGATISPLLANIYLHYVFDLWSHWRRGRHARGDVVIVRYADDVIVGFQHRADAERFFRVLGQRYARFSLALHPEKTRLVEFGRSATERRRRRGLGKPETFAFLGFRHICGWTRNGTFLLMRRTLAKRMRAKLQAVKTERRRRMHLSIIQQGRWLRSVVNGYCNYHAVPTNVATLDKFRTGVIRLWLKTLRRGSQRHNLSWDRMSRIAIRWIPKARVRHPWPEERFDVSHPR